MPRPTATPAPTTAPTQQSRVEGVKYIDDPDVPYLKWEVGPEVPEEHFQGLREGIELMHSYAEFIDATQPVKPATVYLYHNLDALAPSYARVRGESVEAARRQLETVHWRGWAGDSFIFVLSGALSNSNVSRIHMVRLGSHELVHVYQNQMAATGTPGGDQGLILRRGPVWLIEGSAEFLALRAMAHGGTISYVIGREQVASIASRVERPLDELGTYESVKSVPGAYELGAMACELLAATAGEDALMTYWLPPGSDASPEENFRATFGITIDEFYQMFEEHQAAGFPELDLPDIAPRIPLAEADREALTTLYRSTGGGDWTSNDNWLSDEPGNRWHGVETDASGHVTVLDLRENRLNGQLPPELGDLVNLRELRLQGNLLRGEIPPELGRLSNLVVFDLARNGLSGTIPPEVGNLTNLTRLSIWGNELSGEIPSSLGNLTWLTVLSLGGNELTGEMPASLGELIRLRTLNVGDNRLTGEIPDSLAKLEKVRYLYTNRNRLTGEIPDWLGDLPLRHLYLNDNQFTGEIPEELAGLTELETLQVGGNNLTVCLPAVLRDVPENDLGRLGLPDC